MAAIWNDFLNAAKSGAEAGAALARIQNDKSEAAAKLAQTAQAEADQNALGYATLASRERENAQTAGTKLQENLAQQASLDAYRQASLGQRGEAAQSLNDYRNQRLDLTASNHDRLASQFQQKLAQSENWLKYQIDNKASKMPDTDKMAFNTALGKNKVALAALVSSSADPSSPNYALAAKTLADTQTEMDAIQARYAPTSTGTSAADSLATPQSQWFMPQGQGGTAPPATGTAPAQSLTLPATTGDGSSPFKSAAAETLQTPAATGIANPQTKEEFDKLDSGTMYINPSDGLTYRKK